MSKNATKLDIEFATDEELEETSRASRSDEDSSDVDLEFSMEQIEAATSSASSNGSKASSKLTIIPGGDRGTVAPKDASDQKYNITNVEASIRVAVAESKVHYMVEVLADAKLAELQINQLLMRILKKSPQSKAELLQIKKVLADFVRKTNPKK